MEKKFRELEDLILSTLSFYEPMSFSKIVFDIDTEVLKSYPDFDRDQMMKILKSLEERKLVKKTGAGLEAQWQRIHKKRPFWKRFF
jgi:benzoyl-CoA reductase/2-hydroxyglutaryl-CoA dehydratase subunit BcrC/BadD/HgdB